MAVNLNNNPDVEGQTSFGSVRPNIRGSLMIKSPTGMTSVLKMQDSAGNTWFVGVTTGGALSVWAADASFPANTA